MAQEFHSSTHPPLPPTTEDEQLSWLRLLRSRKVGISTFYRLLAEHGTGQAALAALPEMARAAGIRKYAPASVEAALGEMRAGRRAGARLVAIGTPGYPAALAAIDDAPPLLWIKGDVTVLDRPMIGLVGARNASSLGTRMARALARDLGAAGFVVVSGLARGIDTAAHKAALDTGTVAAMAGGVDVIYPAENTRLAAEIEAHGLRLSEQPVGVVPQARHFPRRNRLISGMARALVVVEAAMKSGSLITARCALDQGREVLAVPGHPFDARAAGCNMLIRDGARLVRGAEDVIETVDALPFGDAHPAGTAAGAAAAAPAHARPGHPPHVRQDIPPEARPDSLPDSLPDSRPDSQPEDRPQDRPQDRPETAPEPQRRGLRETARLHQQILARLGPSPVAEDQLIRDLGAPANAVAPALLDLELDGHIARQPGGLLVRPPGRPSGRPSGRQAG